MLLNHYKSRNKHKIRSIDSIYFSETIIFCNFAHLKFRMGRILAIDIGKKRTGIAVTDPLRIAANGLDTVSTNDLIPFLENYFSKEEVDVIVLGYPTQMDGSESESIKFIRPIEKKIKEKFPAKELVFADERFTSVLAHKAMLDGGLKKKARQDKALVDKISATIILQSYLEQISGFRF